MGLTPQEKYSRAPTWKYEFQHTDEATGRLDEL